MKKMFRLNSGKERGIKGYKNMPINELLSMLDPSEPIKENFEDTKLSFKSKNNTIKKKKIVIKT